MQNVNQLPADVLEDHEDTVSIGGRAITNLRFAGDIEGLAGEVQELEELANKPLLPWEWKSVLRRPS